MAIKWLSYCYWAYLGVFRVRLSPGFFLLRANEKITLEMPVGGRNESTVAIRTRYLSLDFFPVVNAPLLGASQCVQLHQQDRPSESKGENRKGGSRDTMQSLSFTHACLSLTAQKYHHLYPLSRHAEDKYQIWQQTYYRCINRAEQMCLNNLTVKTSTLFPFGKTIWTQWKTKPKLLYWRNHGFCYG